MEQSIAAMSDWVLQAQLLQQQLQRSLTRVDALCLLTADSLLTADDSLADGLPAADRLFGADRHSSHDASYLDAVRQVLALTPTFVACSNASPHVHWVIDVVLSAEVSVADQTARARCYAEYGVAEYWSLAIDAVELRTYRLLTATGYQQRRLFHAGDCISPQAFSQITLQLQEPLPLYFLTRTATGTKSYHSTVFPLRMIA